MKEFAAAEWQRACGALAAARELVEIDPNSVAWRAYYAAFHAVTALFALRGQTFSEHSGIRAAVHRDLVHTEEWSQDLGRAYEFLVDPRQTGDYGGMAHVSQSDAAEGAEEAQEIIREERLLRHGERVTRSNSGRCGCLTLMTGGGTISIGRS